MILLALLGGLLALDGTSLGQVMVSRPLVAGTLAGWALGDPALGLLLGGILELYFLPVFPVGGGEFPEGGPPAVVAVATAFALPEAGGLALGALLGFLWSRLGTASILVLRRVNARLVADPGRGEVRAGRVVGAQVAALGLDFARGGLLTLAGLTAGEALAQALRGAWPLGQSVTVGLLVLGASGPAGALLRALGGWRRRGFLFAGGLLAALAGSLLL
jgi:mannose/fructose/N-acetylgalactosamine-specific phosphotransferase system component IIC